jgi:tryptophan synthase alpha chain
MSSPDGLGKVLQQAASRDESLLVIYLTLTDPLVPLELAKAIVDAGADVIEVGIPTCNSRPKGREIAMSFQRAGHADAGWTALTALRDALPQTPLLTLVYPETVADLGWPNLRCNSAGADGLVLTDPADLGEVLDAAETGPSIVPLIPGHSNDRHAARLEAAATHLTYRTLLDCTGGVLNLGQTRRHLARVASRATKPFLAGFGIHHACEIRELVPYAVGVVIGSALLRLVRTTAPTTRETEVCQQVREWKTATGWPSGATCSRIGRRCLIPSHEGGRQRRGRARPSQR